MSMEKCCSILFFALAASACGGVEVPLDDEAAAGAATITRAGASQAGSCDAVCTEVVACCICKCYADLPGPLAYGCAVGCFVLDTVLGEDDAPVVSLASAPAEPRAVPIEVERGAGSIEVEVGAFSATSQTRLAIRDVVGVRWHVVPVADASRSLVGAPWTLVAESSAQRSALEVSRLAPGAYVLRASLAFRAGGEREAFTVLDVR